MIQIKRAYAAPSRNDGYRVLVDRLWPRGVSKKEIHLDAWAKELAPSAELRKFFGHQEEKFEEFRRRYLKELQAPERRAWLTKIKAMSYEGNVTLVYGARSPTCNQAIVLLEALKRRKREHEKAA